jgi:hypothetical protein
MRVIIRLAYHLNGLTVVGIHYVNEAIRSLRQSGIRLQSPKEFIGQ